MWAPVSESRFSTILAMVMIRPSCIFAVESDSCRMLRVCSARFCVMRQMDLKSFSTSSPVWMSRFRSSFTYASS